MDAAPGDIRRLPQEQETPLSRGREGAFHYRLAYARAAESQAAGQPGQDYVAWRLGEGMAVLAVCDGVGQSFYGDLAARFLGDALVDWLWREVPAATDAGALTALLAERLQAWTAAATVQVQEYPLPEGLPALQRQALEQKRAIGSQSMFAAARVDLPGPSQPQGRLIVAWMGDVRLRLWAGETEWVGQGAPGSDSAQRWSTRVGPVRGLPHLLVQPLLAGGLSRLVAYSDGLAELDRLAQPPSEAEVQAAIARSAQAATSDDLSYLDLAWEARVLPQARAAALLPVPYVLRAEGRGRRVEAAWRPVVRIDHYEVELTNGGRRVWQTFFSAWQSPPLAPGRYVLRVRVWREGLPGAWSRPRQVVVGAGGAGHGADQPGPSTAGMPPRRPRLLRCIGWALLVLGCVGALAAILVLGRKGLRGLAGPGETATAALMLAVPSPTPSPSTSLTVTARATPSATHTPAATPTATTTGTPTPTKTPVATATGTPTPTETLAASATRTPTLTAVPTKSATPTAGETPQGVEGGDVAHYSP